MPSERKSALSFAAFARGASDLLGKPGAFVAALAVVLLWSLSGPLFHFTDTWQLVINTGTTIVTFLMVFLVQHTQNRESRALHLKIDELLRSVAKARNRLIDLEHCSDEEIETLERQFRALKQRTDRRRP